MSPFGAMETTSLLGNKTTNLYNSANDTTLKETHGSTIEIYHRENITPGGTIETTNLLENKTINSYTSSNDTANENTNVKVGASSCANDDQAILIYDRANSFWQADTGSRVRSKDTTTRSDREVPDIKGGCFMPDGQIVLCDFKNSKIKLLTKHLFIKYELHVDNPPYDAAAIDDNVAIVSIPCLKQLVFVDMKAGVKLGRTVDVVHTCMDVAVNGFYIYVSVADLGHSWNQTKKDFFGIKIYRFNGDLRATIPYLGNGLPRKVCVSENGERICYAGGYSRDAFVACVTPGGHSIF